MPSTVLSMRTISLRGFYLSARAMNQLRRFVELLDRFTPDCGVSEANRLVHTKILEQESEHRQPIFFAPEKLTLDQFNLFRRQLITSLDFAALPGPPLSLNVPTELEYLFLALKHNRS